MKFRDILKDGIDNLNKHKIENAEFDAKEILLSIIDMDDASFLAEKEDELEDKYSVSTISKIINNFDRLISLRAEHFPLQYILGETYFCGLRFDIDENVLIPRFDTEVLVEKVLSDNADKNKSVLDLCTGSGCIAIALAELGGYKTVIGTDISMDALQVAAKNAENIINKNSYSDEMDQKVYFLTSDMFDNFEKLISQTGIEKFDIITANPPYIKTKDIENLAEEVKRFEPKAALDGDADGLKYYRLIAKDAKKYLNQGGKIYLEIGFDQGEDVKRIFEKEKFNNIDIIKDLSGNDRVVIVKL